MKPDRSSAEKTPETDWLLIGQLELPNAPPPDESFDVWLLGTLQPFALPTELLSQLETSVAEAVSRLYQPLTQFAQGASLKLFVSQDVKTARPSNRYWGFFRLEKVGIESGEGAAPEHVLEYYLYLER